MKNQREHWNNLHQNGDIRHYSDKPTSFAQEVLGILPTHSSILDLGAGAGNDSVGFARAGHTVTSTDFSEVSIEKNRLTYKDVPNITFEVLDLNDPMHFSANSFDFVYARLSLHYFTDVQTRKIIREIHRALKHEATLGFICKSTDDPLYGKGAKIESDMFENEGHVRHFFSEGYVSSLLDELFKIQELTNGDDKFYGNDSAFVKVIAKAIK